MDVSESFVLKNENTSELDSILLADDISIKIGFILVFPF